MSDKSDISLKTVCCTCLNKERKLEKLCRISEGVNLLYLLLSHDSDAFKEVFFKDSTSLHVCWECSAIMRKIRMFQVQASRATRELKKFCNSSENHNRTLSNLSTQIQTNHTTIQPTREYFIDCGPCLKAEQDPDDIPLSELINNRNETPETITRPSNPDKQTQKTTTKLVNLKTIETESLDENDITECLNSSHDSPKENYKKAHIIITRPLDPEKARNHDNSSKSHRKKIHIFSRNKKKRNKNVFNEMKLKYPCPECNLGFENKNIRWKHIQKQHREGHQCSVCDKRFALKSNLQRHEKIHTSPPPREQCRTCLKPIRVDLMQVHSLTHTDRQKYSCISCDKTFVCRDTYYSHLKYSRAHCETDALARYKCNTCGKRYRSQAELRDHVNYQHKGQTVHKCPVCGKGLATKRCIRRHVRRAHEGIKENERDKICQRCGKAFRDKKSLREHEYIHTGERPLSCELCGHTFRQYASLYSHRKRVHKLIVPQKTVTVLNKD